MLGYTDPSTLQIWDYPYEAGEIRPVDSKGVTLYPLLRPAGDEDATSPESLTYSWEGWAWPTYHERKKRSYYIMREAFKNERLEPAP
jgi:hypothetical protein